MIVIERVDDIPLLLAQMEKMGVSELLNQHFLTHSNWQGLSLGDLARVWLSFILSEGDHRLNQLEVWAVKRLKMLQICLGQPVRREDFTDDRLALMLDYLSDDEEWNQFEASLNRHTLRVYDLKRQRVRIDATTAKGYVQVSEDGLFQFGVSKDHRSDLPQVKINLSVLDPLGMPLTTTVVSGESADDTLYVSEIKQVQQSIGTCGVTHVGDCKMGSLKTRAYIASTHDYYLCPLAGVQMPLETLRGVLQPVFEEKQELTPVYRPEADPEQPPEKIAEGFEYYVPLMAEVEREPIQWKERRLVVRSIHYAQSQERALLSRLKKAMGAIDALNRRGRGKKRFTEESELKTACQKIIERYQVEGLIALKFSVQTCQKTLRRYKHRSETVKVEREVLVRAEVDQEALKSRIKTLGWRIYATNQPQEELSLQQGVLAYREQFVIEHPFGRLKNKPLSLTPMYLSLENRVKGLVRLARPSVFVC